MAEEEKRDGKETDTAGATEVSNPEKKAKAKKAAPVTQYRWVKEVAPPGWKAVDVIPDHLRRSAQHKGGMKLVARIA